MNRNLLKSVSLPLLGILFIAAGVNHFVHPGIYFRIVPPYLPFPMVLVYVSGFLEVLGGSGLLFSTRRKFFGWGLIALLLAVLPAHIHMVQHFDQFSWIPFWILVVRIPLQFVLMAWIYWTAISTGRN